MIAAVQVSQGAEVEEVAITDLLLYTQDLDAGQSVFGSKKNAVVMASRGGWEGEA